NGVRDLAAARKFKHADHDQYRRTTAGSSRQF
ncbi:MAG: hypothetical protein QOE47_1972, partial [Pyrinomonadaceae bacterium]|nr:hypothetical protein [Pyrinomonadaceae bacterium]